MKKPYPNREKDRWEHALTRPLHRTPFELAEVMRGDLFEYLDVLTADFDEDNSQERAWRNREIQRTANRLKELTPHRAHAVRAAMKAGRVDLAYIADPDAPEGPECGPFSGRAWEARQ